MFGFFLKLSEGVMECTDLDGNNCIRIDRFCEVDVGIYTAFAILENGQARKEYRVELAGESLTC